MVTKKKCSVLTKKKTPGRQAECNREAIALLIKRKYGHRRSWKRTQSDFKSLPGAQPPGRMGEGSLQAAAALGHRAAGVGGARRGRARAGDAGARAGSGGGGARRGRARRLTRRGCEFRARAFPRPHTRTPTARRRPGVKECGGDGGEATFALPRLPRKKRIFHATRRVRPGREAGPPLSLGSAGSGAPAAGWASV